MGEGEEREKSPEGDFRAALMEVRNAVESYQNEVRKDGGNAAELVKIYKKLRENIAVIDKDEVGQESLNDDDKLFLVGARETFKTLDDRFHNLAENK